VSIPYARRESFNPRRSRERAGRSAEEIIHMDGQDEQDKATSDLRFEICISLIL
jgi:hypothetical protein